MACRCSCVEGVWRVRSSTGGHAAACTIACLGAIDADAASYQERPLQEVWELRYQSAAEK